MNWNGQQVLVTGAGGFIGSNLVDRLVRLGANVRAFVRYNSRNDWGNLEGLDAEIRGAIEVVAGDIRDAFSVEAATADCERVFHLAALIGIPYSYVAPEAYVATNVTGTLNVLQACRSRGVARLVHTSTSEAYGTARYVPIDEAHPLQAQSPYSASKIAADKLAESYHLSFELPVATVRPFNTYGPGQSARAFIPATICQALSPSGGAVKLGSLHPVRDLTYVDDTARGFILAAERESAVGETINLGTGEGLTMADVAAKIIAAVDPELRVETAAERVRPDASEVDRLICDNSKARETLGWEPTVSLDEGIGRTIEFVREHAERFKPEIYTI